MSSTHRIDLSAQRIKLTTLIEHTHPAPIHLSKKTGVSSHRAIPFWGERGMAENFLQEQNETLTAPHKRATYIRQALKSVPLSIFDR